uniref:Uncharacterized protein n=1 Tax=Dromaius novaehollandiae TaxID=8790 RepID=A0A8C4K3I8_DRONO
MPTPKHCASAKPQRIFLQQLISDSYSAGSRSAQRHTTRNALPLHIPKQSITLCEKKAQALQSLSLWLRQEISPIISANPPPIQ